MQTESTNHAESTDDPQNILNSQMIIDKLMGINGIIKEAIPDQAQQEKLISEFDKIYINTSGGTR
jgi:hypothetical protein